MKNKSKFYSAKEYEDASIVKNDTRVYSEKQLNDFVEEEIKTRYIEGYTNEEFINIISEKKIMEDKKKYHKALNTIFVVGSTVDRVPRIVDDKIIEFEQYNIIGSKYIGVDEFFDKTLKGNTARELPVDLLGERLTIARSFSLLPPEHKGKVVDIIDKLPPRKRAKLLGYDKKEYFFEKMCQKLDYIPRETVKAFCNALISHIREELQENCYVQIPGIVSLRVSKRENLKGNNALKNYRIKKIGNLRKDIIDEMNEEGDGKKTTNAGTGLYMKEDSDMKIPVTGEIELSGKINIALASSVKRNIYTFKMNQFEQKVKEAGIKHILAMADGAIKLRNHATYQHALSLEDWEDIKRLKKYSQANVVKSTSRVLKIPLEKKDEMFYEERELPKVELYIDFENRKELEAIGLALKKAVGSVVEEIVVKEDSEDTPVEKVVKKVKDFKAPVDMKIRKTPNKRRGEKMSPEEKAASNARRAEKMREYGLKWRADYLAKKAKEEEEAKLKGE